MAFIIETPNPFEPLTGLRKHKVQGGITILQWLRFTYPDFREFDVPTICVVNGTPVLREHWNRVIEEKDIVNFVAIPQGSLVMIIIIVVAVALAVSVALFTNVDVPKTPGSAPESDPVFSTKGQQNAVRLGEPIEVNYGRNRLYPSYAARPYFEYQDNDQFQFSLFCLGQGEYDVDSISIGDTDIDEYQEVEYEVVGPGEPVTLFPTNVYTSAEAGGQALFAPNEDEYANDGWIGPFPTNPAGTTTTKIQVDLNFPRGGYLTQNNGEIAALSTTVVAEAREVDDDGAPLGAYAVILSETLTWKTTTPQRVTLEHEPASGRYEVRMRRTDTKNLTHRAGHDVVWEGMRGYIEVEQNFGDVTLLAVKIRATNNLNTRTQQQFNVIATRKLQVRGTGGFETDQEAVATRSIVWAFVDVFRSLYGARITNEVFYDWDALEELDALYSSRGEYFDFSFRDPITVWEAAQTIARVGRAVPLLAGSLLSMKRDGPLEVPVAMFGPDNILRGTFEWGIKLWELEEHDSLSVEYTDPNTGYKQEQVTCVLPGGTSDNPDSLRLVGVQDRNHAYREGLYTLASKKYLRENITFETGLEGHLPTYGDLIAISHDVPSWGQSGYVVHAEQGTGDLWQLWVSEALHFEETGNYQILLRGRQGQIIGPVSASQTTEATQVIVRLPDLDSEGIDFLLEGDTEPMLFLFGVSGAITKYAKVVRIEPQGGERIRITAVNDSSELYSFDELTAPSLTGSPLIYPPDLPVISNLYVTQVEGPLQLVQISWSAAFGAQYYIVETSEDGESWQRQAETVRTNLQVQSHFGTLYVRVAAVNTGQGPWKESSLSVSILAGLDVSIPWEDLELEVQWSEVLNANGFRIGIYDNATTEPTLIRTEDLSSVTRAYKYNYAAALVDGHFTRELLISLDALVGASGGGTEPAELPVTQEFSNAVPAPLAESSLGSEVSSVDADKVTYRVYWDAPTEDDLVRLKVWLSDADDFDPALTEPEVDELLSAPGAAGIPTEAFIEVPLDSSGEHTEHYWRVAVFDVWGEELSTNVSEQQTIPAYS